MALNENNTIGIFGENVETFATFSGNNLNVGNGPFYEDSVWIGSQIKSRLVGNVSGVADAGTVNTALRQSTVMACTLAEILSIRNNPTSQGPTYTGKFGTQKTGTETYQSKVVGMANVFAYGNLLIDGEVTTNKIADLNVTTAKIANNAVTRNQILDNEVVTSKIPVNAITTDRINGSAVTTAKIADGSVTAAKLSNDLISSSNPTTGGITAESSGLTIRLAQTSDNKFGIGIIGRVNTLDFTQGFALQQNAKNYLITATGNTASPRYSTNAYFTPDNVLNLPSTVNINGGGNLNVAGYVQCNYINTLSDRKYKSDVKKLDVDGITDFVNSVQAYSYDFKKGEEESKRMIGMIAQELQNWSFEGFNFVTEEKDGLSIKESKLIYVLWEYAKELERRITELESR